MAKPFTKGRLQNDDHSFTADKNGNAARNVVDVQSHELLQAINTALGGSTDTTVNIYNVNTTAGSETAQALPVNCKRFLLRCRNNSRAQIAYNLGDSASTFFTVMPGNTYEDVNFYSGATVYFQTSKDDVVEIITFS